MGNERANHVPAAEAAVQVLPRKKKGNEMKLEVMTFEQLGKKVALDEKKNGKRYAYEFALVKAWLADGGRVIPSRYDGLGTYLFQEGDNIRLGYTWSRQPSGIFCHADRLMDEGFIIVPTDHKIRLNVKSPEWFMRTRKKVFDNIHFVGIY